MFYGVWCMVYREMGYGVYWEVLVCGYILGNRRRSVEVPARQVIVIRVLLSLLYRILQFLLVVFVDELAGLLPLISHQSGITPLLGHGPDLDALGFRRRDQPLAFGEEAELGDFGIESLQHI
jgi:hypothetical protein